MKFYDTQIYPLGIVISKTESEINKHYNGIEGNPIESDGKGSIATTYRLKRKTGNYYAVGIVFRKKPTIQTISHEAFHAAHAIMEFINNDFLYDALNVVQTITVLPAVTKNGNVVPAVTGKIAF